MEGDAGPLMNRIKTHSDPSTHDDITRFFEEGGGFQEARRQGCATSDEKKELFSVPLRESDARKLRALAELEGISPPEILAQIVAPAVTERIRSRLE
jgi:hypothetical protein